METHRAHTGFFRSHMSEFSQCWQIQAKDCFSFLAGGLILLAEMTTVLADFISFSFNLIKLTLALSAG